jgi:hypothetical protein
VTAPSPADRLVEIEQRYYNALRYNNERSLIFEELRSVASTLLKERDGLREELSAERAARERAEPLHGFLRRSGELIVRRLREFDCRDTAYRLELFLVEAGLLEKERPSPPPAGKEGPRPVVLWFAEHMDRVLRRNDHKGGWQSMSLGDLRDRLRQECIELEMALDAKPDSVALDEAVDVANFAMMIADRLSDGQQSPPPAGKEECFTCAGLGSFGFGPGGIERDPCPRCKGTGKHTPAPDPEGLTK